jgi:Uma2 family endonuclease
MSSVLEQAGEARAGASQTAFNLKVWNRLLSDPALAALPFRIETDEHGQMVVSPPPSPSHGIRQSEIARLLGNWNPGGKVLTECPISTSLGVKAADVAWCSPETWAATEPETCFSRAPEICVEVRSPSNTDSEIEEKKRLYIEAGAEEVWVCDQGGAMAFFHRGAPRQPAQSSRRCPGFPGAVG